MIFGRYDDRGEQQIPRTVAAAASPSSSHHVEPQTARSPEASAAGGERPPRPLYPESNRT
jgi:hypothetical protein